MSEEIQPADPRLRRVTAIVLTLAVFAAALAVFLFQHWLRRQAATQPADVLIAQLRHWIGVAMTASGLCLLLLAGYAARLARMTLEQRRWPPQRLRVLRDTPIRRDKTATDIGRALNVAALLLVALSAGVAILGWRFFAFAH